MSSTELVVDEQKIRAPAEGLSYIVDAVDDLVVNDAGDVEVASEMLAQVTIALKQIETQRKLLTGPLNQVVRRLNGAAKEAAAGLDATSLKLRDKIRDYHERQAQERALAQMHAQASSKQRVVDPGTLPAAPEERVETSAGSVSMRKRWTFEVTDVHALIRAAATDDSLADYLLVHTQMVNQFVKAGGRELPGVRIFETKDPVVRG